MLYFLIISIRARLSGNSLVSVFIVILLCALSPVSQICPVTDKITAEVFKQPENQLALEDHSTATADTEQQLVASNESSSAEAQNSTVVVDNTSPSSRRT